MEVDIHALFEARDSRDRDSSDRDSGHKDKAYDALTKLFAMTEEPVDWAYEVWSGLLADLTHEDAHKRSFSAQMLMRLAISDPERRILRDFPVIAAVMRDERFVTARHATETIWRVGLAGPQQAELAVSALEARFQECAGEKNASLVRTDVITALGRLASGTKDSAIQARVESLIASEPDEKARKKQRAAWRKASS